MSRIPPFEIKKVQKKDKSALSLVLQAYFSREPFGEKWTLRTARKRIDQILDDPHVVGWVVMVSGCPVGFTFFQIRQGAQEAYGELLETAVHPYFHHQGMEQALLKRVLQFQRRKKIKTGMALVFRGKHETFFKKAGWRPSRRTIVYTS